MATAIGTLGLIDHLTIGNRVFTDLTNLIQLVAFADTNGKESTFYQQDGTLYATSGSGFRVDAVMVSVPTTAQLNPSVRLGHCASGAGGINQASSTFTITYLGGDSNLATVGPGAIITGTPISAWPLRWTVPSGKNIVAKVTVQCNVHIFGYAL